MVRESGDELVMENVEVKRMIAEEVAEVEEHRDKTVGKLEEVAVFQEVVVWGHEATAEGDDVFVKGVAEWIQFAEVVSCLGLKDGLR